MISQLVLNKLGFSFVHSEDGVEEYLLRSNGLRVVLKPINTAPVTTFMIAYHCGSRDDKPGKTGSAHNFEHFMFKGTEGYDPRSGNGVMEIVDRLGGLVNANTNPDITKYFACVPAEGLPLYIRMEAARMRGLLNRRGDHMPEKMVVLNEQAMYQNEADVLLHEAVMGSAYMVHPYRNPVIGWREDIAGITLADLKEFYHQFYRPDNAVCIVVGDFEIKEVLHLIASNFGKIKAPLRKTSGVIPMEPPQEEERRIEVRRSGKLKQLMISYHVPEATHPDFAALDFLSHVLGGSYDPSSQLYRALIETGLVSKVQTYCGAQKDPGLLTIAATLAPKAEFEEVERAIESELTWLKETALSDERLTTIKIFNRTETLYAKAEQLTLANLLAEGESVSDWRWAFKFDRDFDRVTANRLIEIVSTYLVKSKRTVGHFIPTDDALATTAVLTGAEPSGGKAKKQFNSTRIQRRSKLPIPTASHIPFSQQVTHQTLANGMQILILAVPDSGVVAISGSIAAGRCFDVTDSVPSLVASLMTKGSRRWSKSQLSQVQRQMGTSLGFGASSYACQFASRVTAENLSRFIPVLAEVLQHPLFASTELEITKGQFKAALTQYQDDTGARASNRLLQLLYPKGHQFYQMDFLMQAENLDKIDTSQLESFYLQHYGPQSTLVTVVGDVDVDSTIALFDANFGSWQGPARKDLIIPQVNRPRTPSLEMVFVPGKTNCDITIGLPVSISPEQENYYAALIANAALGRSTLTDRLGKQIRVQRGLTYGVSSRFGDSSLGQTTWSIDMGVEAVNVDEAVGLAHNVVRELLANGITELEHTDKIRQLSGSHKVGLRSFSAIANTISFVVFSGLGLAWLDEMPGRIAAVTREQVNAAAREYFDLDHAITVVAGTI